MILYDLTGDIMGCGILFPRDYNSDMDGDGCRDLSPDYYEDYLELEECHGSESEDDEWWERAYAENGTKVQVAMINRDCIFQVQSLT